MGYSNFLAASRHDFRGLTQISCSSTPLKLGLTATRLAVPSLHPHVLIMLLRLVRSEITAVSYTLTWDGADLVLLRGRI